MYHYVRISEILVFISLHGSHI